MAQVCGISKNISTHIFRHTFASNAIKNGITIAELSKMLNHRDIQTTENNVRELFAEEELDKIAKRAY